MLNKKLKEIKKLQNEMNCAIDNFEKNISYLNEAKKNIFLINHLNEELYMTTRDLIKSCCSSYWN